MKELSYQEMSLLNGGGFWNGFCAGIAIADGVGVLAGVAGVITLSGPAAPFVVSGLAIATIGCAVYSLT